MTAARELLEAEWKRMQSEHQAGEQIQVNFRFSAGTVYLLRAVAARLSWSQVHAAERAILKTFADFLAGLDDEDRNALLDRVAELRAAASGDHEGTEISF